MREQRKDLLNVFRAVNGMTVPDPVDLNTNRMLFIEIAKELELKLDSRPVPRSLQSLHFDL